MTVAGTQKKRPLRILLVNDDGIGAAGLDLLKAAVLAVSDDVWTVAPASERSGAAQAITITQPLRIQQLADREFSVDGSPADCIALALGSILDRAPDVVLSGVNRGPNMADDIAYSGTCGAAREAAGRDIPAVAFSMAHVPGGRIEWNGVEHFLPVLLRLLCNPQTRGFVNVNIPALPASEILGTRVTRIGRYTGTHVSGVPGIDPRNLPYQWLQLHYPAGPFPSDTDICAIADHFISITPIRLEGTDEARLGELAQTFRTGVDAVAGPEERLVR